MRKITGVSLLLLFLGLATPAASLAYLAGTQPDRRPPAPKVRSHPSLTPEKDLKGVNAPFPPSLKKAIASQGGWHTPLTTAGMTGPYDIRGYHTPEDAIKNQNHHAAEWNPLHFKPAIDKATDKQCLACHQNVLNRSILESSQAGVKASESLAWYQTLDTYSGPQADFHWRHLESPYSKSVTNFRCITCHQGHDPREEAWVPTAKGQPPAFTLRKSVNPQICLMCHGQFPAPQIMGLPGPWATVRDSFQNNCMACHTAFRTNRHKVNFLKPEAIEAAGQNSGDSCYGCHGGRAWYRISFPYPRHAWPGMPPETPDWAKGRANESELRFLEKYLEGQGQ